MTRFSAALALAVLCGCGGDAGPTRTGAPGDAAPVPDTAAPVPDTAAPVPDTAAPVPDTATLGPDGQVEPDRIKLQRAGCRSDGHPVDLLFNRLADGVRVTGAVSARPDSRSTLMGATCIREVPVDLVLTTDEADQISALMRRAIAGKDSGGLGPCDCYDLGLEGVKHELCSWNSVLPIREIGVLLWRKLDGPGGWTQMEVTSEVSAFSSPCPNQTPRLWQATFVRSGAQVKASGRVGGTTGRAGGSFELTLDRAEAELVVALLSDLRVKCPLYERVGYDWCDTCQSVGGCKVCCRSPNVPNVDAVTEILLRHLP